MPITFIPIASTILTGNSNFIDFQNIPQTFNDLVLRVTARYSSPATFGGGYVAVQFNTGAFNSFNDTGLLQQATGSVTARNNMGSGGKDNAYSYGTTYPDGTADAYGLSEYYFCDYTNPNNNKTYIVQSTGPVYPGNGWNALSGGYWSPSPTAAITRLFITAPGYNYVAGSKFYLYGIKNS